MGPFSFRNLFIYYCLALTVALAIADYRGWIVTKMSRGGFGRSYSSYAHK